MTKTECQKKTMDNYAGVTKTRGLLFNFTTVQVSKKNHPVTRRRKRKRLYKIYLKCATISQAVSWLSRVYEALRRNMKIKEEPKNMFKLEETQNDHF